MVYHVEIGEDKVPFLQLGEYQLRLDLEELDDEYKERAKQEIGETPDIVENALAKLKLYIAEEPGLHVPLDDATFLIKFLRPFKFNIDTAFKVLQNYYKFKVKHPQYGQNVTPNNVRHVFDNEVFAFLPTRTLLGSRTMIINVGTKWNPKIVSLQDMFKSMMVALEIAMMEPKTQVAGAHVIINMAGFGLTHVFQFSPFIAKTILDWVQDCVSLRLEGIHVINQSSFFNMVYAIFKPFIGERLKERIFFYGSNIKLLRDKISAQALPEHLGGTASLPEYPGKLLSEMFYYYESEFTRASSYGYFTEKITK